MKREIKRVTIVVDGDLDQKLRNLQSRMIQRKVQDKLSENSNSVPYSKVLNLIVTKGLTEKRNTDVVVNTTDKESRRITVMIDTETDKRIKIRFGEHIIESANNQSKARSWSYSREVNRLLRLGFRK